MRHGFGRLQTICEEPMTHAGGLAPRSGDQGVFHAERENETNELSKNVGQASSLTGLRVGIVAVWGTSIRLKGLTYRNLAGRAATFCRVVARISVGRLFGVFDWEDHDTADLPRLRVGVHPAVPLRRVVDPRPLAAGFLRLTASDRN
jgi:hypothetical protein